ncbi:tetratricopeptide repeat protein 13-like isoform X2 [Lineus longissimus]|uniref:tetratricopeptide repeat protein 13-like isoform X2 n=1 Tax=Lineus longissimus TaxID=88925 RepID=UPI00315D4CBD
MPLQGECLHCNDKQGILSQLGLGSSSAPGASHPLHALAVIIAELHSECEKNRDDVPINICSTLSSSLIHSLKDHSKGGSCSTDKPKLSRELIQSYADTIAEQKLVPLGTGNIKIDKRIAYGLVLINTDNLDEGITHFTKLIEDHPDMIPAYHGRGSAYARKSLQANFNAAYNDFTKAIDLDRSIPESYERRAEVLALAGLTKEALEDISQALKTRPTAKLYFLRGVMALSSEDLTSAEMNFREALDMNDSHKLSILYYLGITLYYKGKLRNAIAVFKDVIKMKPDHLDAFTSMAHSYSGIGNFRLAMENFNHSLTLNPQHIAALQLRGLMFYQTGYLNSALVDFQKCLSVNPQNQRCMYMKGVIHLARGNYFDAVKTHTKVMIGHPLTVMRVSSDFIRAHYLREYARYLHAHVDTPFLDLRADEDFVPEFKDKWIKYQPLQSMTDYREQHGIQPNLKDVSPASFKHYPQDVQELILKASKIGALTQVNSDGFLPNQRLNLAMGLAAIHIAQVMEGLWKGPRNLHYKGNAFTWRHLFNISMQYRRVANPDQPVFWMDQMREDKSNGFQSQINFIKGHVVNIQMMQYYDLVFKLVKTTVEHYNSDGAVSYPGFREEIDRADTCDDLLRIAKKRHINPQGFMVPTQVPSYRDKNSHQLEGVILTLTGDNASRILFSINLAATKGRTTTFHAELDFLFNKLNDEIRRTGISKIVEFDSILNIMLSLVYYFYNLMPLSKGSSVVAYSVALGLIMSIGKEVTGKIPQGKLVDVEAMLSGAPDAFILVAKQWMNIKRLSTSLSMLPSVEEVFPTVRSIIEVLNAAPLE